MPATALLLLLIAVLLILNASNIQQVMAGKMSLTFTGKPGS